MTKHHVASRGINESKLGRACLFCGLILSVILCRSVRGQEASNSPATDNEFVLALEESDNELLRVTPAEENDTTSGIVRCSILQSSLTCEKQTQVNFSNPAGQTSGSFSNELNLEWLYLRPRTTFGEINIQLPADRIIHEYEFEHAPGLRIQSVLSLNKQGESFTLAGTLLEASDNSSFNPGSSFQASQRIGGILFVSSSVPDGILDVSLDFLYQNFEATWNKEFQWTPQTSFELSAGLSASSIDQIRTVDLYSSVLNERYHVLSSTFRGAGPVFKLRLEHRVCNGWYSWASPGVSMLLGRHKYREFFQQPPGDISTHEQVVPVLEFRGGIGREWETKFCHISLAGGYQLLSFQGLRPSKQERRTLATETSLSGLFAGITFAK